jgi:hypothetical protein
MKFALALLAPGAALVAALAAAAPAARLEITHPARGHQIPVSGAAVAVAPDGAPVVAWAIQEGADNILYAARPGEGGPVRVNPTRPRWTPCTRRPASWRDRRASCI